MTIKAVLLDLDNTLLDNPQRRFVLEYLRLIDAYFAEHLGKYDVSGELLAAVRSLTSVGDGIRNNTDIILDALSHSVGLARQDIEAAFKRFYEEVYPDLAGCVKPVPAAKELIGWLFEKGYQVVIATNPLYPPDAIRQRLEWAGLPDSFDHYELVTHSDNMHFVKPDPAYYAEIVARVGVEPDEALMLGDDPVNDIEPANVVGLNTYRVLSQRDTRAGVIPDKTGYLHEILASFVKGVGLENLQRHPLTSDGVKAELRGNVGALFGLVDEVAPHYWNQHPDREEWSPLEIICHLWDSESKVQRPRLERILQNDNPFLASPKEPPGPFEINPCAENGVEAAHRFAAARAEMLAFLEELQADAWQRRARHSIFGPTTLVEMAHFTAQHDRLHLDQLCQTVGRCV